MKQLRHLHLRVNTKRLRTATYEGREHLVVPTVALKEGVIWPVNADTPEYVPKEELSALGWDGRPCVLGHPTEGGEQVPANTPERLERLAFGKVFNTAVSGDELVMEPYVDPDQAAKVPGGLRLLERLRNHETIEVSVGVFVNAEETPGVFGGKPYDVVWRNIVPDHLAFLDEDAVGACSVVAGCGALRHAISHNGVSLITAGSPDQPRDDHGRWEGGSSGNRTAKNDVAKVVNDKNGFTSVSKKFEAKQGGSSLANSDNADKARADFTKYREDVKKE